jgi:hypothetical protein
MELMRRDMTRPPADLNAVRSHRLYRVYIRAWRIAAIGVLLLVLTGLLSAAGTSPVVLTVLALPGAALAAGGIMVAIGCTVGLLPALGTTAPRQQVAVIRMVLRDLVRSPRPPGGSTER